MGHAARLWCPLGSLYRLLRECYGLSIARGERSLEAVAANQWEARVLDLALASPLLRLDSVAYRADGRAFEYSQALHRGDCAHRGRIPARAGRGRAQHTPPLRSSLMNPVIAWNAGRRGVWHRSR